jgi:hypothetical protein
MLVNLFEKQTKVTEVEGVNRGITCARLLTSKPRPSRKSGPIQTGVLLGAVGESRPRRNKSGASHPPKVLVAATHRVQRHRLHYCCVVRLPLNL